MPKEVIRDALWDPDQSPALPETIEPGAVVPVTFVPPRLRISWGRESGDIQIATVHNSPPVQNGMEDQGWYVNLDRQGCNRAIRALRKARDQAFGQDA